MSRNLDTARVAVIGATGGIGSAVVGECVAQGAAVLATGRDPGRLDGLRGESVHVLQLDVGERESPARLAKAVASSLGGLDALVIATGALGPIGPTRSVDPDAVLENLRLGPVAALRLIQGCADLLDASPSPSVTLFSGGGATDAFPRYSAYAVEKVAIVRLVENLAAEETRWRVNCVAPGFVATGIHAATFEAGPEVVGDYFQETERRLAGAAVPPTHAAQLCAFLASPEAAGISGRLISAVWDPWREPEGREVLRTSDSFGRLRRIDGQWFEEARS